MGYDVSRFQGQVDEELICPICFGVFEEPLHAPQCDHVFCKSCIHEWLTIEQICPVDRQPLNARQLKPVPRILQNLISHLFIMCDHAALGCTVAVKLETLEDHREICEYNPKTPILCKEGCGKIFLRSEIKEHNCIQELSVMLQNQQQQINEIHRAINEIREVIGWLKFYMQSCNHSTPLANFSVPVVVIESLEQDEFIRWKNSLRTAHVTRWSCLICTPVFSVLQNKIRNALRKSGCPPHVSSNLMENIHEERWPLGLRTLVSRQSNRRYCKRYVCKRIPRIQAVIVLAIDNPHMKDDMVLEPGFILRFARGIQ